MTYIERPPFHHLRRFEAQVPDGILTVLVGREPIMRGGLMGWHLSISHKYRSAVQGIIGRIPTWGEIKEARYKFTPDEVYMAMILPPRAEYVDVHPTTMHLYEMEK